MYHLLQSVPFLPSARILAKADSGDGGGSGSAKSGSSGGLDGGAIAGIIIGITFFCVIVGGGAYYVMTRQKRLANANTNGTNINAAPPVNNPVNSGAVSGGAPSGISPPVSAPVAGVAPPINSDNIPKATAPEAPSEV